MTKEFKTHAEQIGILKSKNLIIFDCANTRRILERGNYYNIINAYNDLFLDSASPEEKYVSGVKFEEIVALFKFDKKLKKIFLERLLKMENAIKSVLAYEFSNKYGKDNYLLFSNFDSLRQTSTTKKTINKRLEQIHNLISDVQKTIAYSCDKKKYINHYLVKYGFVPLWVLVNAVTFGTVSKFYGLMKQAEKIEVAKKFGVPYADLDNYIKIMSFYRNICAHDERLYDERETITSIPDTKYHLILKINKKSNRYIYGKNDLFSLYITLKVLMSNSEFSELKNEIYEIVKDLKTKLTTIPVANVLEKMGFPKNWRALK